MSRPGKKKGTIHFLYTIVYLFNSACIIVKQALYGVRREKLFEIANHDEREDVFERITRTKVFNHPPPPPDSSKGNFVGFLKIGISSYSMK